MENKTWMVSTRIAGMMIILKFLKMNISSKKILKMPAIKSILE